MQDNKKKIEMDPSVRICDLKIFQFNFCFMTAFTDEFRSFVDCSLFVSFGDCKFFIQTQMALLHPAVVWDLLVEDYPCNVG